MADNISALRDDIAAIVQHTQALPPEAEDPISHYRRTASDCWNLLVYIERHLSQDRTYAAPRERHLHRLHRMVLLSLVEAFERFIKETAALCIDHIGPLVLDDRLKDFKLAGNTLAAHFTEKSLGKSLCESDTWLDCQEIDDRFRRILAEPFSKGLNWYLFPTENQAKGKMFLDDTANVVTQKVVTRMGELLTGLHKRDQALFDPKTKAQDLADLFRHPITIGAESANPTK